MIDYSVITGGGNQVRQLQRDISIEVIGVLSLIIRMVLYVQVIIVMKHGEVFP